jgi:hypothetical protein
MGHAIDRVGKRFGRLVVVERGPQLPWRTTTLVRWWCVCDCGQRTLVRSSNLLSGQTRSCGCLTREMSSRRSRKHGLSGARDSSRMYSTWSGMRQRCRDKNHINYNIYGGRGIRVCEAWSDFEAFVKDVGPKPSARHSLDRINTDGDYEPGNVRWATAKEQSRNIRRPVLIECNGVSLTAPEWEERCGVRSVLIRARIRLGWTAQDAMTRPLRITKRSRL